MGKDNGEVEVCRYIVYAFKTIEHLTTCSDPANNHLVPGPQCSSSSSIQNLSNLFDRNSIHYF